MMSLSDSGGGDGEEKAVKELKKCVRDYILRTPENIDEVEKSLATALRPHIGDTKDMIDALAQLPENTGTSITGHGVAGSVGILLQGSGDIDDADRDVLRELFIVKKIGSISAL